MLDRKAREALSFHFPLTQLYTSAHALSSRVLTELLASEKKAPEGLLNLAASSGSLLKKIFTKNTTHQMTKSMRQRGLPFTPTENSEKTPSPYYSCTEARYSSVPVLSWEVDRGLPK